MILMQSRIGEAYSRETVLREFIKCQKTPEKQKTKP